MTQYPRKAKKADCYGWLFFVCVSAGIALGAQLLIYLEAL